MEAPPLHLALVGTPNSGKTSLFNALTGSRQKVANYPGVTVEKKIGRLVTPGGHSLQIVDLPGTYSLRARSPDEEITRDVVLGRHASEASPDLIVCVGDASNLRLALRLALELKRVGRPVMLALNMMDIARKRGMEIDASRLTRELGMPVVQAVAVRRGGTEALLAEIDRLLTALPAASAADWRTPDAGELRISQREADRILRASVKSSGERDRATALADSVLLHPVAGLAVRVEQLQANSHSVAGAAEGVELGSTALAASAADETRASCVQADSALDIDRLAAFLDQPLQQDERGLLADPPFGLMTLGEQTVRSDARRQLGLRAARHFHQHPHPALAQRRDHRGQGGRHGVRDDPAQGEHDPAEPAGAHELSERRKLRQLRPLARGQLEGECPAGAALVELGERGGDDLRRGELTVKDSYGAGLRRRDGDRRVEQTGLEAGRGSCEK